MTDQEIIQTIRREVERAINIILSGQSGNNDDGFNEDIQNLYPGMPTIPQRPVVQPYGLSSRTPDNKLQVTAKSGNHPGSRYVMGHRDKTKPIPSKKGETILYDEFGHIVYLSEKKMQFGSTSSSEPMVLGTIMKDFMSKEMHSWLDATQIGWAAGIIPVFLDPGIRTLLTAFILQYVTTPATNVTSNLTFTEKGPAV